MSDQTRQTIQVILVPVLFLIVFLVLLWAAGVVTFTDKAPSDQNMAAALALVGAFIASTVSFAGIVLKHSIDVQTDRRLRLESERNAVLQRDAENRLKLEAAIKAIELLATKTDDPSLSLRRAGSLLSLASLGQYDLTMALTSELLLRGEIEARTACQLIHNALTSGNEYIQRQAITALNHHAGKMLTPDGMEFPECLADGFKEYPPYVKNFPPYVREWAAIALGSTMIARPIAQWSNYKPQVNTVIAILSLAWKAETVPELNNEIGAILAHLLQAFPHVKNPLHHPREDIDIDNVRLTVKLLFPKRSATIDLVDRIDSWASQKQEVSVC